ncbi:hypothetical protein SAMN06265349_101135 [Flavobacterium resistens]|uniref:Lipoprotein n=1 Tax=Flavobacterium resistens TaxID=443612 RepID=A0A521AHM0_9FLAO|nr:hypothetical protein [Flavobacterium resistens]MRX69937.1 hypothetical protein [Flavobacterium resistens]SMO34309.1 hypothetical protein SAMN06265349_101135 [Flavobacterium resistens]
MNKNSFLFLLLIMISVISCNSKEDKNGYQEVVYRAVHQKDTAILVLNINEKRFFGRYEILYHQIGKDSGDVRGDIKGDTLRGDFHYISNGGSWKRIPLAFLKKDNKLISGNGVIGTYMSLPCFIQGTLNYNEPRFVFEEIKK